MTARVAFVLLLVAACWAAPVAAQTLYKLVDKAGKVTYVDRVPKGFEGEVTPIVIDPATNAASPVRVQPMQKSEESKKDGKDYNTRRRDDRARLQLALDQAQAKLAAAQKALADGLAPMEDEYQVIQQKIDAAGAKPGAQGPRSNCRLQGNIFVCPTIVPGERYRERQTALEEAVRIAEAELAVAETAFRRGTD